MRWVRHVDHGLLLFVSIPLLLLIRWQVGGITGFAVGFAAGFCAWYVLRILIAATVATFFGREVRTPVAKEVARIVEQAWRDERYDRAVTDLKAMVPLHGEDFHILLALSGMLLDAGRGEEALEIADRAIALGTDCPELLPQRALAIKAAVLRQLGRPAEAYDVIAPVVEADWKTSGVLAGHAMILADLGRILEARGQVAAAREKIIRLPLSLMFSRIMRRKWHEGVEKADAYVAERARATSSAQSRPDTVSQE
jgi:tetratricopeptide (TPR) repeat protein